MEAMYDVRALAPTLVITGFSTSSYDLQVLVNKLNHHYRSRMPASCGMFVAKWGRLYFVLEGNTPRDVVDQLHEALLACCEPSDLALYDEHFNLTRRVIPRKRRKQLRAG